MSDLFDFIVVGGGTMGTGIVYVSAYAGYDVTVVEPSAERAEVCRRELKQAAQQAVTRGKLDADGAETMLARIRYQSDIAAYDGPRPQVVIETVSERRDLKHRVLAQIEALRRQAPHLLCKNAVRQAIALGLDHRLQVIDFLTCYPDNIVHYSSLNF